MRPNSHEPARTNCPRESPLRALTGLRFVAAFWVVFFHFFRPAKFGIPMPASIDSILESGYCDIGLFFALRASC
jgi:peptidoglycan/LPS O-acetylase OafA/YrhL